MANRLLGLLILLAGIIAACDGGNTAPPPPTEVVIVRPLATVGPTATLSDADRIATQQAVPPTQAAPQAGPSPTPTAYIGMFLGESPVDPLAPDINVQVVVPTRPVEQATPLVCTIAPAPQFGTVWSSQGNLQSEMGCPLQESFGFTGVVQVFEGGVMYHYVERDEVWAIAPGEFGDAGDYWFLSGVVPLTPSIIPPEGRRVPQNIFGGLWAGITEAREELGFALLPEQDIDVNIQRYEGGTLFLDVTLGQVFVLTVDGRAYGPF